VITPSQVLNARTVAVDEDQLDLFDQAEPIEAEAATYQKEDQ
jgi:hypothetical protein